MEGIATRGRPSRSRRPGLRKPVGELYPSRAFLEMALDAGSPIALSSDAHTPDELGRDFEQALELSTTSASASSPSSSAASGRLEPIG
jgi:histidinol-phosphatase (PHP family)